MTNEDEIEFRNNLIKSLLLISKQLQALTTQMELVNQSLKQEKNH